MLERVRIGEELMNYDHLLHETNDKIYATTALHIIYKVIVYAITSKQYQRINLKKKNLFWILDFYVPRIIAATLLQFFFTNKQFHIQATNLL